MSCCASRNASSGAGHPSDDLQGDRGPGPEVLARANKTPPPKVLFHGGPTHTGTRTPVIPQDGEGVIGEHRLEPFRAEAHAVTNSRFAAFVTETGYRTVSERLGQGLVFRYLMDSPRRATSTEGPTPWWAAVPGACWYAPEGPGSSILERMDHPVTHISWGDAAAFAAWAGGRLPTEAEWEHAARGGLDDPRFPWGDEEPNDHDFMPANIWQGTFPDGNSQADGYAGTAPVDAFSPNGAGLFNMAGNVWEWTSDPFRIRSAARYASLRNSEAVAQKQMVMKGGSFLCHISYCYRYRIAARSATSADSGAAHCGVRVFFSA
ncbi:Formylglycine-generating enzyme, required for sulfatase activity, contains SUMF1/FGE domain [Ensifer adhaerens]|nr:Formylglycine-generating enzyme, required for sulfatase activity, contains SUMF1/FGE domain [Ensifer adhaerens]